MDLGEKGKEGEERCRGLREIACHLVLGFRVQGSCVRVCVCVRVSECVCVCVCVCQ